MLYAESVAQLAEHQVVALVAVGSNPITLPGKLEIGSASISNFYNFDIGPIV